MGPDPASPVERRSPAAPRTRPSDHLAVLGLLVVTVAGAVPLAFHLLVAPWTARRARRGLRRRLGAEPPKPVEPRGLDPAKWNGKTVFVVAGEPSGDRVAGRVVAAMRERAPGVRVRGYGGPATEAAGAELDERIVDHAVVGVVAVARSLGTWWGLCARTLARFRDERPDLVLTVDFPGLNLRLARWARKRGIPTVHLVAPQTWGWASWRTARLRRAVDRLLVTFPFEEAVFREADVEADFVGHPLFEAPVAPPLSGETVAEAPVVELRPGSRRREVLRQGPIVLDAAARIEERVPGASFVVRVTTPNGEAAFRDVLARAKRRPDRCAIANRAATEGERIDLAVTTSGTSTSELAVQTVPMVVFYRVSWLARLGASLLVTSPFIAMANLVAGRSIVPERLVGRAGGTGLGDLAADLLADPDAWRRVRSDLAEVRARLSHEGVSDRVARAVLARL